jgi:hypothetical protein
MASANPAPAPRPKRRSSLPSNSKKPNGKSIYAEVPSSEPVHAAEDSEEIDQLASSQVTTPAPPSNPSPNKLVKKNKKKREEKNAAKAAGVKKESKEEQIDEKEWLQNMLAKKAAEFSLPPPSTPAPAASTSSSKKKKASVTPAVGNENKTETSEGGAEPKSTIKKNKSKKKVTLVEVSLARFFPAVTSA